MLLEALVLVVLVVVVFSVIGPGQAKSPAAGTPNPTLRPPPSGLGARLPTP